MTRPLHEVRRERISRLLDQGETVALQVEPEKCVGVPDFGRSSVCIHVGANMAGTLPTMAADGMRFVASFNGVKRECFVPWDALVYFGRTAVTRPTNSPAGRENIIHVDFRARQRSS